MSPNNALAKSKLGSDEGSTAVPASTAEPTPCTSSAMPWDKWSPPYFPPPAAHDAIPSSAPPVPEKEGGDAASDRGMISREEVRGRGDGLNADACTHRTESFVMIELRRLLTAAMFFTRLPCPSWVDHNPRHLVPGMLYFPAIGTVVGLWVWLWLDALAGIFPRMLASAGAALLGTWLTGCFHEDGLADTVDAFGGGWGKNEILRIMKDSRVGTYAVVVVSLFMFAKVIALSLLPEASTCAAIVVGHITARWTILPICYFVPYVAESEEENDKVVYNSYAACLNNGLLSLSRVVMASLYVFTIAAFGLGVEKACMIFICQILFCICSGWYALGVLDGVIGDYLGATIMVSELLTYVLLVADWDRFWAGGWKPILRLLLVLCPLSLSMVGAGALPKDRAAKKKGKAC